MHQVLWSESFEISLAVLIVGALKHDIRSWWTRGQQLSRWEEIHRVAKVGANCETEVEEVMGEPWHDLCLQLVFTSGIYGPSHSLQQMRLAPGHDSHLTLPKNLRTRA